MVRIPHGIHEGPGNGGFTAPYLTGQQGNLTFLKHVLQAGQRLLVALAQIEKAWVRGLAERFFPQAVKLFVHLYHHIRRGSDAGRSATPQLDFHRSPSSWWPR